MSKKLYFPCPTILLSLGFGLVLVKRYVCTIQYNMMWTISPNEKAFVYGQKKWNEFCALPVFILPSILFCLTGICFPFLIP